MKDITIILGSITKASRAKKILSGVGITAELIKSSNSDTGECLHVIRINNGDMYRAAMILRKHNMDYTVENDISR